MTTTRTSRFDGCSSLEEAKLLYRKELLRCHPDQGGSDAAVIELMNEFDAWVSRRAWQAHKDKGYHWRFDPEEYLSQRTKDKLRTIIESGLNVEIEIVGSFIWVSKVPEYAVLQMIAMDFNFSKKYGGRWYWADFEYLKETGRMPKGKFRGTFEDMKAIHRNKLIKGQEEMEELDDGKER